MWMLSFIPDEFLYHVVLGMLFLGISLYILSLMVKILPSLSPFSRPIRTISILIIIIGVYFYGSYDTEMSWRHKIEEGKKEIQVIEKKSDEATVVIKNVYITKEKIIKDVQKEIQEKIVEVEKVIDSECKVHPSAITILNQAAKYPVETKK